MQQLTDQNGRSIVLDRKLGSGGEADIYSIGGQPGLVGKIYFRHSPVRQAKLKAMIGTPPADPTGSQGHISICWPKALLFNQAGAGVGFLMHRVDVSTSVPVFRLYNPQDRQQIAPGFTWGYLLRTAANIASVVEAIHACGYVVGDLNESNFLVSDCALVTLVDCDSMQVPDRGGRVFRCTVGKPDFTAPELQGCDFSQADRTPVHDNFALGVLIFQLLMEGVHPHAGVWRGHGDPPSLEERIRSGSCPYAGSPSISPMPVALPFEFIPSTLKALVVRCFGYGHKNPASRPSPREWREGLTAVEKNLSICQANRRHVYPVHLSVCPWCERTVLLQGFDPFASVSPQKPLTATPFVVPRQQSPPPRPPAAAPVITAPPPPPAPPAAAASGFGMKAAVGSVILIGLVIWSLANRKDGTAPATSGAPEQIVDQGVCPYEGCRYGERWMARQSVDVYATPPNAVGTSLASLSRKATVRAGTWVRTETGLVLARRLEGRVTVTKGRPPYGVNVKNGPPLMNGQIIPIYSYLGEGCWSSWISGQVLVVCDVTFQGQAQSEWWIQIRTADGSKAWTNSAGKAFVSEESLNSELGEKIADDKLALREKLAQIDTLLKGSANLNGSGGKYGTDPMWAAIRSNDTELMKALMSRGLNIRKTQPCAAYPATQSAVLRPGGDAWLDFLLENGLRLDCLGEPPLQAFLRSGIATDNYPVDEAIRVANVLIRHGANVNQRDSQGKTIFDVLDQAKGGYRVRPLREALSNSPAEAGTSEAKPAVPHTKLPALGPASLEELAGQVEAGIKDGNYERALTDAESAVRLYPGNDRARALLERVRRIRSILK